MKPQYTVRVKFKGIQRCEDKVFEVDGYSTTGGVLQLYTHFPRPNSKIEVFPLVDIEEINIEENPE